MSATAAGQGMRNRTRAPSSPGVSTATTNRGTPGAGSFDFFSWLSWTDGPLRILTACSDCKICTDAEVAVVAHDERVNYCAAEDLEPPLQRAGEYSLPVARIAGASSYQKQEVICESSPTACNQPSLGQAACSKPSLVSEASVSTRIVSSTLSSGESPIACSYDGSFSPTDRREETAERSHISTYGANKFEAAEEEEEQTLAQCSQLPAELPGAQLDVHRPASEGHTETPVESEFAEESLLREQSVCLDFPSNLDAQATAAEIPAPDATPEIDGSARGRQAARTGLAKSRSRSLDACGASLSHAQGSRVRSRSIPTVPHSDTPASDQPISGTPDEPESEQQPSVADAPSESPELVAAVEAAAAAQAELEAILAASAAPDAHAAVEATETQELAAAAGEAADPAIAQIAAPTPTHVVLVAVTDAVPEHAEKDGERADLTEPQPPNLEEPVEAQTVDADLTQDFCTKAGASRATSSTAESPLSLLSEQQELGDSAKSAVDHEAESPLSLPSEQQELGDCAKSVVNHEEILSPHAASFDGQLPARSLRASEPQSSKHPLLTRRGTSITARAQAYAAACQSTPEKSPPPRPTRKRQSAPAELSDKPERPFRTLSKVTEQRVLKAGLVTLGEKILVGHDVEHMELPKTSDGIPKVMQGSSFLRRLLKKEIELKGCMEGDVAAAQADVKHLRAEQLLSIRLPTLDFATESQSHSARNSFLDTTDKYLFYKLAQRCLTECSPAPDKFEALHRLGLRISVTLGVLDHLSKGWGTEPANVDVLPLPPCWVIKLDSEDWPQQCRAAIFHSEELWVRSLPGEAPDFEAATTSGHLAIVRDRTIGIGKDRLLHWEMVVMESCNSEDILYEMDRDPAGNKKSSLTAELNATISQRFARNSV